MAVLLTIRIKVDGKVVTVADETECESVADAFNIVSKQLDASQALDQETPVWSITSDNAEGAGETLDWS